MIKSERCFYRSLNTWLCFVVWFYNKPLTDDYNRSTYSFKIVIVNPNYYANINIIPLGLLYIKP